MILVVELNQYYFSSLHSLKGGPRPLRLKLRLLLWHTTKSCYKLDVCLASHTSSRGQLGLLYWGALGCQWCPCQSLLPLLEFEKPNLYC